MTRFNALFLALCLLLPSLAAADSLQFQAVSQYNDGLIRRTAEQVQEMRDFLNRSGIKYYKMSSPGFPGVTMEEHVYQCGYDEAQGNESGLCVGLRLIHSFPVSEKGVFVFGMINGKVQVKQYGKLMGMTGHGFSAFLDRNNSSIKVITTAVPMESDNTLVPVPGQLWPDSSYTWIVPWSAVVSQSGQVKQSFLNHFERLTPQI